ncbi:MerR family transcriptional regulator [bacterium]|nr:MerR family transcriptional regulator [bacterium]
MIKDTMKERTLTPQEVRTILKADNREIVDLCKKAEIRPRKNAKGHTYFSYDEVKNLRKIQAQVKEGVTNPISSRVPALVGGSSVSGSTAVSSILASLQNLETKLSDRIAKVIDEKLEGMDDVVVELIRCKTDNETLKQKIVDLNKEVYQLKNELNSYRPVALGFYKKKEVYVWE